MRVCTVVHKAFVVVRLFLVLGLLTVVVSAGLVKRWPQMSPSPKEYTLPTHSSQIGGCTEWERNTIRSSLEDTSNALARAHERLANLYDVRERPFVYSWFQRNPVLASTYATFNRLIYPGDLRVLQVLLTDERARLLHRIIAVILSMRYDLARLDQIDIQFYCGTEWLHRPFHLHDPRNFELQANVYVDARPVIPVNIPVAQRLIMVDGAGLFVTNPSFAPRVLVWDKGLAGPYQTLVCFNRVTLWAFDKDDPLNGLEHRARTFTALRDYEFATNDPYNIEHAVGGFLPGLLIPILSRMSIFVNLPLRMNGTECFHQHEPWHCLQVLAADSPQDASRNPLTLTFLVIALFLDKYDWSVGKPVKIGSESLSNLRWRDPSGFFLHKSPQDELDSIREHVWRARLGMVPVAS